MPKPVPMEVIAFRLPAALVKRLEKHAARMRREQPGVEVTKADVVRFLLGQALDAAEGGRHGKA